MKTSQTTLFELIEKAQKSKKLRVPFDRAYMSSMGVDKRDLAANYLDRWSRWYSMRNEYKAWSKLIKT